MFLLLFDELFFRDFIIFHKIGDENLIIIIIIHVVVVTKIIIVASIVRNRHDR